MITGAGRGIGREVARELARRRATVALTDKSTGALNETVRLISAGSTGEPENIVDESNAASGAAASFRSRISAEHFKIADQFSAIPPNGFGFLKRGERFVDLWPAGPKQHRRLETHDREASAQELALPPSLARAATSAILIASPSTPLGIGSPRK